jgi:hypothetical protein
MLTYETLGGVFDVGGQGLTDTNPTTVSDEMAMAVQQEAPESLLTFCGPNHPVDPNNELTHDDKRYTCQRSIEEVSDHIVCAPRRRGRRWRSFVCIGLEGRICWKGWLRSQINPVVAIALSCH